MLTKPIRLLVFRVTQGIRTHEAPVSHPGKPGPCAVELVCGTSLAEEEGSVGKVNGLKCYKVNRSLVGSRNARGLL